MYEKIRLKGSQEHVFARIAKELQYMPEFYRAKCEARYVRYQEYLRRIERIKNDPTQPILTAKNKKVLRREASREARSKKVAQIENAIERELLDRLQKGVYGDIYNLPQKTFETILDNYGEQEEINEDEFIEDSEADSEYESDEEIDDLEESDIEFEDYMGVITKEKRQPIVNVEYEIEEPMEK